MLRDRSKEAYEKMMFDIAKSKKEGQARRHGRTLVYTSLASVLHIGIMHATVESDVLALFERF